ncbi:MAG: choice-of-anchor Q domain-containing protein [Actinomycetota bacterium]
MARAPLAATAGNQGGGMQSSGNGSFVRARRSVLAAFTSSAVVVAVIALASPAQATTITVNCSSQNLQTKINAAPAGATLLIKGTCIGNFLVNKVLTLKGNPSATLDGNDSGTTLTAPTTHTVHLIALTITGGAAIAGAGINRQGSGHKPLTLNGVTVEGNLASGPSVAEGGGIFANNGPVTLTNSHVVDNRASVSSSSGSATAVAGGMASNGPVTLVGSTVSSNRAVASSSVGSAVAVGGGLIGGTANVKFVMMSSHVDDNRATSIAATSATSVNGGLAWSTGGDLVVQSSTVSGNLATATTTAGTDAAVAVTGGFAATFDVGTVAGLRMAGNQATATSSGGNATAVAGGFNASAGTKLTMTGARITGTRVTATGAGTATAVNGGLESSGRLILRSSVVSTSTVRTDSGTGAATSVSAGLSQSGPLSMTKTTIDQNHLIARSDSSNAVAVSAGMSAGDQANITASTISRNTIQATATGSSTAQAQAAGIRLSGSPPIKVTNSTVASNIARAESSAATGTAISIGGGIDSTADSLLLTNATLARNLVGGVGATKTFRGGGLAVEGGTTTLKATILALNTAPAAGGPNCFGPVASAGNNVLGTTAGCTFAHKPTDKLNRNPQLGALANNGGPTLTLALLNGSPALNVIAPAACAVSTDQRGVHRPQGPRCDVGSYERKV